MMNPPPAADARRPLSLRFAADLDLVEGILAVAQDWAERQEIRRDDGLSLRLVLEELITNVCRHAGLPSGAPRVSLQLELMPPPDGPTRSDGSGSGLFRITISDTGKPFNPLSFTAEPVSDVGDTPVGGRGLTLVRLLTSEAGYRRAGGENVLSLVLPLAGQTVAARGEDFRSAGPVPGGFRDRVRALWSGSLAVRQTALFTLCSVALLWGAMGVYLLDVGRQQSEAATVLATQAMHSQAVISSNFVNRVGITVGQVAASLRAMPDLPQLSSDSNLLVERLRSSAQFRSLMAEIPVIGLVVGHGGTTRLYRISDGEVRGVDLDRDLSPFVASGGAPPRWQSVFIPFEESGPHAVMLYGEPLSASGLPADGWIGTVISMPWIADALRAIGGFRNSVPFFVGETGHYMIYPVGRRLGVGPQSLADEARQFGAPGLIDIEKRILAGEKGVTQLRRVFGGDATPWPLPWKGATSLAYYPMLPTGWYLGLLISSDELGDTPQPLPLGFFLLAVLGPLVIGAVTWFVTFRTLRPVRDLASAIERFGGGDMDAPFPTAPVADEIGRMLTIFERVRVTLRASFRNLASSAATQERIFNELGLARDIQTSMLPVVFPQLPWAKVHASIDMSHEVCGDLYDCFIPSDDASRICCVIGDVCGKGVAAAIVMSRTISLARAFLMEGLMPSETLARLNDALVRGNNSMMFVTMLVGILDADGTFSWASAGHPPPLVGPRPGGRSAGDVAHLPWSGELVLGVRDGQRYSGFSLRLDPGQSLLLYTDGADEALGPPAVDEAGRAELYGVSRLAASFEATCRIAGPMAPDAIIARLTADLSAHMAGQPLADDISLMAITYAGSLPRELPDTRDMANSR